VRKLGFLPVFLFFTLSCGKAELAKTDISIIKRDGTSVVVKAEIARTQEEHARGFMERKNIPAGTGMLFVFTQDQILSFWMKNTPTPLSIAYIDSSGVIREIHDMTPFSLSGVTSAISVRYALEVPQGWFASVGVTAGDKVGLNSVIHFR
jgi:uncharacterized membrane protein (UPF0127 family)